MTPRTLVDSASKTQEWSADDVGQNSGPDEDAAEWAGGGLKGGVDCAASASCSSIAVVG